MRAPVRVVLACAPTIVWRVQHSLMLRGAFHVLPSLPIFLTLSCSRAAVQPCSRAAVQPCSRAAVQPCRRAVVRTVCWPRLRPLQPAGHPTHTAYALLQCRLLHA
ncbi:hypothetical protein [Acetobacter senegalensis]|uniref:hypothetical protein n=1 Tax=Acetobacter senegalensis TaxID=446692 RepID=UPI0012FD3E40|nr:hypothetical protein [Acetobacter senegalensis]